MSDIDWFSESSPAPPSGQSPKKPKADGDIDWFAETQRGPGATGGQSMGLPSSGVRQFPPGAQVSYETEGAADIGDVAAASLARELEKQISYYSQEMGVPREKFGLAGGDLVYERDDGSLQAVAPGIMRQLAQTVGPTMPVAGGAAGAIAGAGAGLGIGSAATGAAGGALGAAAGEAIRQNVANWLGVQQADVGDISEAAALEGAYDLGAGLAGTLLAKGVSRVVATRAAKELNRMIRQEGRQAMDALKRTLDLVNKSYGMDVRLTPAEMTNLPKLKGQQLALNANPETAQTMMPFYGRRGAEFQGGMPEFLSREISPTQVGSDVAGENLAEAAGEAVENIRRQRALRGSPAYRQAFAAGPVDIDPLIEVIDRAAAKQSRPVQGVLNRVKLAMSEPVGGPLSQTRQPITDLETIQNRVKETIDDEIGSAMRAGRRKQARRLKRVQDELLETLDEQNPLFKEARALWGDLSGPVTTAEGGVLPRIADARPETFAKMGETLFGRASPMEIHRAREAIIRTPGGSEKWNAALRGFLEDRWAKAGDVTLAGVGREEIGEAAQPVKFWRSVYGQRDVQKRMKAAMDPRQWRAFRNLMDVMEATGRAINWNSSTFMQQEGGRMTRVEPKLAQTARIISTQPMEPIARAYEEWIQGRNLDLLADIITRSDSVDELIKATSAQAPRYRTFQAAARAINLGRANVQAAQERRQGQ